MRWRVRTRRDEWRRWFAWYPVRTIDRTWVWLEVVEKIYFMSMKLSDQDYRNSSGIDYVCRTIEKEV